MTPETELHPIAQVRNELGNGPWRVRGLPTQLEPILAIDAQDLSHLGRRAAFPEVLDEIQGTAVPLLYLKMISVYHFSLGGQLDDAPFDRPLEAFRPRAILLPRGRRFRE